MEQNNRTLTIIEFFLSSAFFGVIFVLAPFLTDYCKLSQSEANAIFTNYTGFVFIVSLVGGLVGGSYLSYLTCCVLGCTITFLGYLFIAINPSMVTFGFTFIACGSGLMSANLRVLIGSQKPTSRWDHYTKYSWFQWAASAGQIVGPISLGLISRVHEPYLFFGATIYVGIALLFFVYNYNSLNNISPSPTESFYNLSQRFIATILIVVLFSLACFVLLGNGLQYLSIAVAIMILAKALDIYKNKSEVADKKKLITLFLLMIGFLIFTTCTKQAMSIISSFAKHSVDHTILGINFPGVSLLSIDPLVYLLIGIGFSFFSKFAEKKSIPLHIPHFFSLSLFFMSLAYSMLWLGTLPGLIGDHMDKIYFVLYSIFTGTSGFFMLPTMMAVSMELSSINWRCLFMGIVLFILSISAIISNQIAKLFFGNDGNLTIPQYHHLFECMGIGVFILAILLSWLWNYWWKKQKEYLP